MLQTVCVCVCAKIEKNREKNNNQNHLILKCIQSEPQSIYECSTVAVALISLQLTIAMEFHANCVLHFDKAICEE